MIGLLPILKDKSSLRTVSSIGNSLLICCFQDSSLRMFVESLVGLLAAVAIRLTFSAGRRLSIFWTDPEMASLRLMIWYCSPMMSTPKVLLSLSSAPLVSKGVILSPQLVAWSCSNRDGCVGVGGRVLCSLSTLGGYDDIIKQVDPSGAGYINYDTFLEVMAVDRLA
eukprot:410319-Amphidinium_carterae.1